MSTRRNMLRHFESKCLCSVALSMTSRTGHLHNNTLASSRTTTGHLRNILSTTTRRSYGKKASIKSAASKEFLCGILPAYSAVVAGQRQIHEMYMDQKWEQLTESPLHRHYRMEIMEAASAKQVNVSYLNKDVLDKLSRRHHIHQHQGVMVQASKLSFKTMRRKDIAVPKYNNKQFWLALTNLLDPTSFGSILRACYFYGVNRVIVNQETSCPLTATVAHASEGAVDWVPVYSVPNMSTFLSQLNVHKEWDIVGTFGSSGDGASDVSKYSCENTIIDKPSVLVVGGEDIALNDDIAACCTKMTTVTSTINVLPPGLDSLNISVDTGILLDVLIGNRERGEDEGSCDVKKDQDQGNLEVRL